MASISGSLTMYKKYNTIMASCICLSRCLVTPAKFINLMNHVTIDPTQHCILVAKLTYYLGIQKFGTT